MFLNNWWNSLDSEQKHNVRSALIGLPTFAVGLFTLVIILFLLGLI